MIRTILLSFAALLALSASAPAQNMSQMGMRGCCNCTTPECLANIKTMQSDACTGGQCNNLCVTDKECAAGRVALDERLERIDERVKQLERDEIKAKGWDHR